MTIYDSLRSLRVRRSGVIGFDEIDISISPEHNTRSYYGKVVASNLRNAFTSRYNYAIIDVNSWTSSILSCPDNYVEFRFAPVVIDEITIVYSEDISVEEGTPKRLFEIKYIDGTVDTFNFGGTEIDGIKYQTIKPSNKKAVYFRIVFRLDETDEKLIERLKLYHLLITARYEYNAIGYFDSDGNFVPVSSSFPLPISGEITGASGFPYVLGWEDVTTFVEHPDKITIVDEEKAFDKDFFTCAQFTFKPGGEYAIIIRKPVNISGVTIFCTPTTKITELTYMVAYDDGTSETGTPQHITDVGGYIPVNPAKRCIGVGLKNYTENDISVNICEFLIYSALQVYNLAGEKTLQRIWFDKNLYLTVLYEPDLATVEHIDSAFDRDYGTKAKIKIKNGGYVSFVFSRAIHLTSVIFMMSEEPYPSLIDRKAVLVAEDGTDKQVTIDKVSDLGYIIRNDNPELAGKRITHLILRNNNEADWIIDVNEIIINYAKEVRISNNGGNIINPATEETLTAIKAQTDKLKFDDNNNLLAWLMNPALAYDADNNLFLFSIERDNVGLMKDSTAREALPRNITQISGTALSGRDWSLDFAKLQKLDDIELYLSDLDIAQADFLQLKHSGSFTSGTYTTSCTPAKDEIVFIEILVLNSYTGRAEAILSYGGDTLGRLSVDADYYEMNAQQYVKYKVIGDGSTPITLDLEVYADGEYFCAVRLWKVRR